MHKSADHKRILLRADANTDIGHGHLMRLLALAEVLKVHYDCHFITHNPPATLMAQMEQVATIIFLPAFDDVLEEAAYLVANLIQSEDIFIADGYHFTSHYQQLIRDMGARIVWLDDLHEQYFYADVVINPAGGLSSKQYETELYTRLALGPAYALLRQPFKNVQPGNISSIENVLICFGGSDMNNLTQKTALAVLDLPYIKEVHLITGASYQHQETLEKLIKNYLGKIFAHQQLSAADMVNLMRHCHVSIAPASTISYELCSVGIGLVTGTSAANQQNIAHFLTKEGCALNIGDFHQATHEQIHNAIRTLNVAGIRQQVQRQQQIFKPDTTSLLIKIFQRLAMEQTISYRESSQEDLITYFEWTNEPETRRQAMHPDSISLENHSSWFLKKIASNNDFMFIFEQEEPIGQVRFDAVESHYLISYSVDQQYRGKGLGTVLIKLGLEALQKKLGKRPVVIAYVKPANTASLKVFEQNSFVHRGRKMMHNVTLEVFEK